MHLIRNKLKADWTWITTTNGIIFIVDDQAGGASVTNCAEQVVREVVAAHGDKRIVYQDTMGRQDELVHVNGSFIGFTPFWPDNQHD